MIPAQWYSFILMSMCALGVGCDDNQFPVAISFTAPVIGDDLKPGAPAPSLEIREWLKGEQVARLDPAKTYVVEFWATWCGPCIESIPHVSELARQHQDIVFLGVSVLEESKDGNIKRFVEKMGDKMSYRVGYSGNKDGMAATWLKAASQDGIPTAFIVKGGIVQWIGHPGKLDKPLGELKAGTFDLNASKTAFEAELQATKTRREADTAFSAVVSLRGSGNKQGAAESLDQAVKTYPRLSESAERIRYEWLAEDDAQAWLKQTESLTASGKPESLGRVTSFALRSAQKPKTADRARTAIRMALASGRNDWDVLLYARTIYLKLGDHRDALAITERMIELHPKSPAKENRELLEALTKSKSELEAKTKK